MTESKTNDKPAPVDPMAEAKALAEHLKVTVPVAMRLLKAKNRYESETEDVKAMQAAMAKILELRGVMSRVKEEYNAVYKFLSEFFAKAEEDEELVEEIENSLEEVDDKLKEFLKKKGDDK